MKALKSQPKNWRKTKLSQHKSILDKAFKGN